MQKGNSAHFDLVKMHNRKLVRNILREKSPQGISELAEKASLSYPTVAALLKELVSSQEVRMCEEGESCGGRPGQRYELNAAHQYALVMYFNDWTLQGSVYNAFGQKVSEVGWHVTGEFSVADVLTYVRSIKEKYSALNAVAIGAPGAVCGNEITYLPKFQKLVGTELAISLQTELGVAVFIENDINAIALAEIDDYLNFAHIAYVNGCIGVGIVLEGKVIKGAKGFAGELEYLCEDLSNQVKTYAKSILTLVCVLDVPDILISGEHCGVNTVQAIKEILAQSLPAVRIPCIHVVEDIDGRYQYGLLKRVLIKWTYDE